MLARAGVCVYTYNVRRGESEKARASRGTQRRRAGVGMRGEQGWKKGESGSSPSGALREKYVKY